MKRSHWALLNAVGLVIALVLNGLAAGLPLNGMDTGELSDLYPNLFVPVGLTFSIWGVIYSWLIAFVVYGFARRNDEGDGHFLDRIGPFFLLNGLFNAAWIVAWHWMLVPLSLFLMLAILGTLLAMYLRLGVGVTPASAGERWLVRAPLSVYLGWITVATIANVTTLAVDLGAPAFGEGPAILTVVVLLTALGLAGAMLATRRDVAFALVVAWAFFGVWLKRYGAPDDGSGLVAGAALGGLLLVLGGVGITGLRRAQQRTAPT